MRRVISFIGTVALTFYLAVIYKSDALVYLGFAEIVMVALCLVYSLLGFFGIRVSIEAPLNIAELGQKIPVKIKIQNYSIFPSGKIGVQLVESHALFRRRRKVTFYAVVEGREIDQNYNTTVINTEWYSNYTGKAELRIKKVRYFDLLGVLALPLPKKKYQGKEEIIVLPSVYEVPIDVGNAAREFVVEQERYIQSNTDDTISDHFQIREYQPGDKIRSVHWKLSAKSDDLMVRDYKTVMSCPVLLFLDIQEGIKQKKKKVLERREEVFTVLLSISVSMIQQQCSHYVVWYDAEAKDVLRCRMEREEDMYSLLMKISKLEFYPKGFAIEEAYYEKYHEKTFADKLVLDWNLRLVCNEEIQIMYDAKKLKESLTSQEIFFG